MEINHDLVAEVMRLKDARIMFPETLPAKKRHLSVLPAVVPPDRPSSQMEWWLEIMRNCNGENTLQPKPQVKKEIPAEIKREPLTKAQKDILKSLSYNNKPRVTNPEFSIAA